MSPETGSKLPHSVFTYKPAVPCMGPQVLILKSSVLFTSAMDFRYSFLFMLHELSNTKSLPMQLS